MNETRAFAANKMLSNTGAELRIASKKWDLSASFHLSYGPYHTSAYNETTCQYLEQVGNRQVTTRSASRKGGPARRYRYPLPPTFSLKLKAFLTRSSFLAATLVIRYNTKLL